MSIVRDEAEAVEREWLDLHEHETELICEDCDITWPVMTNGHGQIDEPKDRVCPNCGQEGDFA